MKDFLTYFWNSKCGQKAASTARRLSNSAPCNSPLLSKSGFGLIEVMIAAVVLGFLLVGLNLLQKGNREGILRVRARDSAVFVAHHVLDSLGGAGLNSLSTCIGCGTDTVLRNTNYIYKFGGNTQRIGTVSNIAQEIPYSVVVFVINSAETKKASIDSTHFSRASRNDPADQKRETNEYSKSLEAIVSWKFKESEQSIRIAKVVR